jgi:nucleoside-diphosphate-sugar epimerase
MFVLWFGAKIRLTSYAGSSLNTKITFVVVPDITAPEGFDKSLEGVDYVMHVASPIPGSGTSDHLTPAVKGTISVLQSALKVPSIRKVVITASIFSLIPIGPIPDGAVVRGMSSLAA